LTGKAILVIGLALALTSCSASNHALGGSSPSRIAISGSVTAGPTCPVESVGQPCLPAPVHGTVVAKAAGGGQAAQANTEADGHYTFTLPPGRYTFLVEVTGGVFPRCPSVFVTVRRGAPELVGITCDTGIR
jgi:hypothetical protein